MNLKIASLLPSSTEIVCALGLEGNLVGVTHECDFPETVKSLPHLTASKISHETMSSREIDEAVRAQIGEHAGHDSIYNLDAKLLHDLQPDLILTQELCDVCAVSFKEVEKAARMYTADAKVVSLEPTMIQEIFANVLLVGKLCGVSERAEKLVADYQARLDFIQSKTENIAERPRTLMLEWLEPPFAPGHWVLEQVKIAGGDTGFGNLGKPSTTATWEQIRDYAPEKIVLIPCGYYISDIIHQIPKTKFPDFWCELPAVQSNEVWATDASAYFSRPAPRVVDGTEILAKILHPTIFGAPKESEAVKISDFKFQFPNS
ncbi:MAG: cobalamin-binding protein [Pyrinomonadaceae bacterium]|nr:cobalamin-binding protein [Pyrinomonadaceae bacterium]